MASHHKKRFLCVWFPWFMTERLVRKEPELAKRALGAIEEQRGRLVVAAANQRALRAGLRPGMVLADARAIEPTLQTRFVNRAADRAALVRLAGWATRYTPWAALAEQDSLFLDLSGCSHLFGGEEALAEDLTTRLEGFGLTCAVGLADTPGAAWAVAHQSGEKITILPPFGALTDAMDALKDISISGLRLASDDLDGLASFGLRKIGGLYPLARRTLTERFGPAPVLRLDQALGVVDEPISPFAPVAPHEGRAALAEPVSTREAIEAVLHGLLDGLCQTLNRSGEGARALTLSCHRVDGTVSRIRIGTSRPSRWPQPLFRLFAERLDGVDPGFGIEVMVLSATQVEPLKAIQGNWHVKGGAKAGLADLVDRLGNRFGFGRITRPQPRQSWLPERAIDDGLPFAELAGEEWPSGRERPLRLLAWPEEVEAVAPVPDDPPMLFRRRGRSYRVRAADGPERLEGEWWLKDEAPRDYYQVEDEAGRRYWLYRQGLYEPGSQPKWFLHGVFA